MTGSCWLLLALLLLATERSVSKDVQVGKCWLIVGGTCPDNKHITFNLYTRNNKEAGQQVKVTESKDNLEKTFFNATKPNKVVIHGFNADLYTTALLSIKDAYLEAEDANVWMVDWSDLSLGGLLCAPLSLQNTGHVGECLGQLVKAVQRYTPHPHFHVVASGAGATVAHYLARAIQPDQLARITALNPAMTLIQTSRAQDQQLNDGDAEFVDIMHTTAFMHQQGRMGHFDVYFNPRGFHQPGCRKEPDSDECDRFRGLEYFAESIMSEEKFLAWPCDSYKQYLLGMCAPEDDLEAVGEPSSDWARGLYITFTASEPPYALGPWDGDMFKERGPALHNGKISQISTKLRKKIDYIKENTPDAVQDFYLVEKARNHFTDKADGIKDATARATWRVGGGLLHHTFGAFRKRNNQNIQTDAKS